jgi:arylsulfatase A-like enzyme/tetratricopeptide (TPR) repeat protein
VARVRPPRHGIIVRVTVEKVFRFLYLPLALLVSRVCCANPSTPVILISVDTLRADHLSCYEPARRPTPQIDSLTNKGTVFTQVSSPFPLTLPAHASVLTSTDPAETGVQDNGVPLKSSAVTLATVLKKAGYATGAFVASFVLDRRFGLNQGFDVYEGPVDLHNRLDAGPMERKRPGAQVVQAATRWLERNSDGPFFLFLHLYDLHLPYDLPQNPALRHGEAGYSAELAYEDRVLGDLFAFLVRRHLFEKALIVFTSDHGEGLGDHGESTHGYFIYQSTLHVPLIIHWPAGFSRSPRARVEEPASLLDVAPTILDAAGGTAPREMHGRSLIAGAAGRDVYSESLYARNHFGCATLRSLRDGRYKYIEAPKPELYDLSADPKELHNLYGQQASKAAAMAQRLAALRAGSAPTSVARPAPPKSDAVRALRSLGYLSGPAPAGGAESRIDPKDRIADFERFYSALSLTSAGKLSESGTVLRSLRDKYPGLADIRFNLGLNHQRLGDFAQAALEFQAAVELAPTDAQSRFELGFCNFRLGKPDDAIPPLKAALALEPWYTRAEEALAEISIQKKDYTQARAYLNHLLSIDPGSYTAHYNLGILAAMEGNWSEAQQRILSALRTDPSSAEAHDTLGKIYFQRGELESARQQFQDAIRLAPNLPVAHYDLALVLQKQGKTDEAEKELQAAKQAHSR